MADTYGITPADIAAELRNLFPEGFAVTTTPSLAQVIAFITVADLEVSVAVENAAGVEPEASDRLAPLARQVIINRVIARILRIVYTGNAPSEVAAFVSGYVDAAKTALAAITSLETQAAGGGEPLNRVMTPPLLPTRDLLVCDQDLRPPPQRYGSGYGDRGRFS